MDLQHIHPINLAAFAMSAAALGVSLLAMFPGLKGFLAVARDAVLWVALFFVMAGAGFFSYQQMRPRNTTAGPPKETEVSLPASAPGFGFERKVQ